ncbi:MAG: efflux RND transporter permease subunit [Saprospiraceae bacterium]|nr:efflux RND transporter permease subunit [Saprospiraceae bacterium]
MIRYLIQRPVAVLLSFALLLGLGVYFFNKIPVSLLPTIDVPRIVISTSYPDHTASEIEAAVLKPLREALLTTDGLIDISSKAASHNGTISIVFGHGTRMDLAYVEVNEK